MLIPSSRDNSTPVPSESIRFSAQAETSSTSSRTATAVRKTTEVPKLPSTRPARVVIGVEPSTALQGLTAPEPVAFAGRLPQEQKSSPTDSFLSNGIYDISAPAAALMPLREKDAKALDAFFERDDAEEIEAEINRKLLLIWPEPCWEDDPLDFLQEYL